ncbi:tetraspanin-33-like [Cyprinus carpio]|uniref:Tetraspanin-33-like n=1 Tax=Cyprinus carpio TaxID=7962 RepID=A0A9Q9YK50_CYPCA|nr:tetraspanin-33-like [Cyprinus carpio]
MHFNASDQNPSLEAYGVPFSCCIQLKNETVFNSMCGYETQKMKNSVVSRLIYTTGCLDEIVWWGKQNLLLICMMSLSSVQLCQIRSVQQKKRKRNPLLQQKVLTGFIRSPFTVCRHWNSMHCTWNTKL